MNKPPMNLFDIEEVIKLGEYWIKENQYKETGNDDLDAYYNGISSGVMFMLMLIKRTGD
jgi:hypothetical protein